MSDPKLTDAELTALEAQAVPRLGIATLVVEIREHRTAIRKLHAQVDQTDPDDAVGVALTRAGLTHSDYGPDDVVALLARVPSRRLIGLLDRIVSTTGAVASTLSASEWHELQDEASKFRSITTLPQERVVCGHCDLRPAACLGNYGEEDGDAFACNECCGHGCEDGWCIPIGDIPAWSTTLELNLTKAMEERDEAKCVLDVKHAQVVELANRLRDSIGPASELQASQHQANPPTRTGRVHASMPVPEQRNPEFYKTTEALAQLTDIPESQIVTLLEAEKIEGVKVPEGWLARESAVKEYHPIESATDALRRDLNDLCERVAKLETRRASGHGIYSHTPGCACTHEEGDSDCAVHPTCTACGASIAHTRIAAELATARALRPTDREREALIRFTSSDGVACGEESILYLDRLLAAKESP